VVHWSNTYEKVSLKVFYQGNVFFEQRVAGHALIDLWLIADALSTDGVVESRVGLLEVTFGW